VRKKLTQLYYYYYRFVHHLQWSFVNVRNGLGLNVTEVTDVTRVTGAGPITRPREHSPPITGRAHSLFLINHHHVGLRG